MEYSYIDFTQNELTWWAMQHYLYDAGSEVPIEVQTKDGKLPHIRLEVHRDSDRFHTVKKIILRCE